MQHINAPYFLQTTQRVLLIIDASLSDFLFLHTYLTEFVKINSGVKFDFWINRDCDCVFKHKQTLNEKKITEFLQECNFVNKIYFNTCSTRLFKLFYKQAYDFKYQTIVVLSKKWAYKNIKFAKQLNPKCVLVAPDTKIKWFNFIKQRTYKGVSAKFDFRRIPEQFFGDEFAHGVKPAVIIPRKWMIYAKLRFMKWGVDKNGQRFGKVYFINAFDDDERLAYPFKSILDIAKTLKQSDEWGDVSFVLHVPPSKLQLARKFFAKHSINNMILFSADHNFFQLPSIISLCDGVLSVDGVCLDIAKILEVNLLKDISC